MPKPSPPTPVGASHRWIAVPSHDRNQEVHLHLAEAGLEHRGRGPSLLLVHGWPQHFWCWREVLPKLAQNHHVLAVDLRGHGWSEVPAPQGDAYDKRTLADELGRLITALDLDRPVLIGHDWGGFVSLLLAGRSPSQVRGVVAASIVAPWTDVPPREMWRFAYQLIAGGPLGTALQQRALGQGFLKLIYRLGSHGARKWSDDELAPYLERYADPARAAAGHAMYARFLRAEMPAALKRQYQKPVTELPILLLPGEGDTVLAPKLVRRALGPSNIEVRTIAGAGHWIPEEQPEELVRQVEAFLARLGAEA